MAPQLSLSYSSRAGNGLLGVGWSLGGLSIIAWCSRTIAQDGYTDAGHFNGEDGLCLDGNRLIPVSPPKRQVREYRTEQETFARVIAYEVQDNVPDYFKVFTKDGKILTFGGSSNARVEPYQLTASSNLAEPSLVRSAGTPRATTSWALDRVDDRNGNSAVIDYSRTEGNASDQWWMQLRPEQIRYTPNRAVKFYYDFTRPDKMDDYAGGTHTRTDARMTRIEMWGGPTGGAAELLRQYRISFQSTSITGRSLLRSITECDRDMRCKFGIPFDYTTGSYNFKQIDVDSPGNPAQCPDGCRSAPVSVVDVNGDGLSDVIIGNGPQEPRLRVAMRRPEGDSFSPLKPSGLPGLGFQTVDVDGNGRPEALAEVFDSTQGPGRRYQLYQPTSQPTTGSSFTAIPGKLGEWRPSSNTPEPVYFTDLDGNGLPDFVEAPASNDVPWSYRLNTGTPGTTQFAPKVGTEVHASNPFDNYAVDTNGDGRTELISPQINGRLGWLSWGLTKAGSLQNKVVNLRGGPTGIEFGDVNGDGLSDAVRPDDSGQLRVQLNSGNGFGSRLKAPSPAGYHAPQNTTALVDEGVRIVDFNGDGRDDVLIFHTGKPDPGDTSRGLQLYLWQNNSFIRAPLNLEVGSADGASWDNTQVLDMDGDGALDLVNLGPDGRLRAFQRQGGAPDRLIGIGNDSFGPRTEIENTNLANRAVHTPGLCAYPLTCPINGGTLVASYRAESDTPVGPGPTWDVYRFTYAGARTDLTGRGWLGFSQQTVQRVGTGATTVTTFDNQTRDPNTKSYPFALLPRTETHTVPNANNGAGRQFRSTTVNGYEVRRYTIGTVTVQQHSAIIDEEERAVGATTWDSLRHASTTSKYDDFGNPKVIRSATEGGRTRTQDIDHRNDTNAWLIGLPSHTTDTSCTNAGVCTTRELTIYYDDKGNPTTTVAQPNDPTNKLTTITVYGQFGVITSVTRTDEAGQSRTDTREYDTDLLYPTATINAAGQRTVIQTHSGLGLPLSTTDPNGVTTTFRYDRFGRLAETNHSDGNYERITRSTLNQPIIPFRIGTLQLTTTVTPGGTTAELADQLGRTRERRVTAFDGTISTAYTDYEPLGRGISRTSRPSRPGESPQYTLTTYDNRGRVTSVTDPDGARVRHEYINRETHTYDAKNAHSYILDTPDGQIDTRYEDDPNSDSWLHTRYDYGPLGQTTSIIAPDGTTQTMHYDALGQLIRLDDPSSGATITKHNAFGEVTSITQPKDRVTKFTHDALGRLTKTVSPDGVATNTWDTAAHGVGQLAEAHSTDGATTKYTYTSSGKDATTIWTINGVPYELGYGYDQVGRMETLYYPKVPGTENRLQLNYGYNNAGYLNQVTDADDGTVYWKAEARDAAGQLQRESVNNGAVVTHNTYDNQTGLLRHTYTDSLPNAGRIQDLTVGYDVKRNVTSRTDTASQWGQGYTYDSLNRLTTWQLQPGSVAPTITTYAYDGMGNLASETSNRQPHRDNVTYRYGEGDAPPHALTSIDGQQYRYDDAGRQITGPKRTVTYNQAGLPRVLTDGLSGRTEFVYDADGGRVLKHDSTQTVVSLPGYFERRVPTGLGDPDVHNISRIVILGRTIALVDHVQAASGAAVTQTRTTYLLADDQGSITVSVRTNGQHEAEHYDPFGQRIAANGLNLSSVDGAIPPIGYTGHEHDDEHGLINMKGRIYDPQSRRFLTPDPVQDATHSQSLNRYSYVQNNPATLTDPTGYRPNPPAITWDTTRQKAVAHEQACIQNPSACEIEGFSRTPAEGSTGSSTSLQVVVRILLQIAVFAGDDGASAEGDNSEGVEGGWEWLNIVVDVLEQSEIGGKPVQGLATVLHAIGLPLSLAEDDVPKGSVSALYSAFKTFNAFTNGFIGINILSGVAQGMSLPAAAEATTLAYPAIAALADIGSVVIAGVAVAGSSFYAGAKVRESFDASVTEIHDSFQQGFLTWISQHVSPSVY